MPVSDKIKLSVVIPAFNERDRLPATLQNLLDFFASQAKSVEVIVVDDGSSDGTAELVSQKFANKIKVVKLAQNSGKGAAVRTGVLASQGEEILFCDADGSTPIAEINKLQVALQNGYDMAIGSRKDNSLIGVKQPFYRVWMGKTFNFIVKLLTKSDIKDTQCGFKLLKGDSGRELFSQMKVDGFSFDVELLFLAFRKNLKVAEIPVIWIDDARSKVVIWRDPIIMFWELLRIRLLHRNSK